MTIGIPSVFSFQSSNVTDKAETLEEILADCEPPVFDKGLEVESGEWVYEYRGKVDFIPKVWDQVTEAQGVYMMDEIVFKDCKLMKVVGKKGTGITKHQRPKEPEEYGAYDKDMDYTKWKHRYIKVTSSTKCSWLERLWNYKKRQYAIYWSGNSYSWVARDITTKICNTYPYVKNNIKRSSKYSSAADVKATIIHWAAPGRKPDKTVRIRSMVERNKHFYLRTNVNAPVQYNKWTTGTAFSYSYLEVDSPADIDGFVQKRRVNAHNPFDGKNYTKTVFDTIYTDGKARWTLVATEPFDSVAFGRVIADTIDFVVTEQDGKQDGSNVLFQINNYKLDNSVAPGRNETYPSTVILYTDKTMPAGSVVTITLNADVVEVGEMMPGSKLNAGFTKMKFSNKFKDFSPKEQDQWGNWYYKDGVRVSVHTGTVEFPVISYDMLNRLMLMIGGQSVLINSSDSIKNELPDGHHVFEATMLIARFLSFDLSTNEKNKRIGDIASYNFTIEELV